MLYEVITGAQTTEKEFARALRVMFTPTLLFLDEQGNVVLRLAQLRLGTNWGQVYGVAA